MDTQKFIDRGLYPDLIKQSAMDFDYEVETIRLDRVENKVFFYDEKTRETSKSILHEKLYSFN